MTSYLEQYAKLPHLLHGKPVNTQEILKEVVAFFSDENICNQKILIAEQDPLRFALSFIFLLENGAIPVPVSIGHLGIEQCGHIENLSWLKKSSSAVNTSKPHPSYICLSSGTTGKPKEIHLSLSGAFENAKAHAEGFSLSSRNTLVQTLPIHHSFGIIAYILTPLLRQIPVDFSPALVGLRSFKSPGHRVLHISPSQARFILKDKFTEPIGIEKITIGAGTIGADELDALHGKFPNIDFYVSYGLTEAGPRVTAGRCVSSLGHPKTPESWIGSALPGIQLKVFNGVDVVASGRGTLCVQTPSLCLNLPPEDLFNGWLKTRDEVILENDQVYFLSRRDDIIKCGGVTIFPMVMENQVRALDSVTDVIVMKIPDPIYEEVPVLYVEGSVTRESIEEFCRQKYPPAQSPRFILVMGKFPRQSLNKVNRRALQELLEKHRS